MDQLKEFLAKKNHVDITDKGDVDRNGGNQSQPQD